MAIEDEGSISFRIRHQDKDWATNDKPYDFPPIQSGPIRAHVVKHPTHKIEIRVAGPLRSELVFEGKLPPVREEGLTVAVTWSAQTVRLFLDGQLSKTVNLAEHRAAGNGGPQQAGIMSEPVEPPPSGA
jgi:hypothetical protein